MQKKGEDDPVRFEKRHSRSSVYASGFLRNIKDNGKRQRGVRAKIRRQVLKSNRKKVTKSHSARRGRVHEF